MTLDVMGIVGVNSQEWVVTDLACNLLGVTSIPLYETLGQEMVNLILKESEMTTIFGTVVCLKSILKNCKGFENKVKTIVLFDQADSELQGIAGESNIKIM